MKILTTIHSLDNIESFFSLADGFILGDGRFAKTITHDFKDEIVVAIDTIFQAKKEVFVLFNKLFTDFEIEVVKSYVKSLPVEKITGFIGADLGLLYMFKELGLESKFVYNPETLLTNDEDFNDLATYHIKGAYVSREITLNDVLEIGSLKKYQLFMFGHGHMAMFYSKRPLLTSFNSYQKKDDNLSFNETLRLKEKKRVNEEYPVYQDYAGTHVFRGHIFHTYPYINELSKVVDYLVIDTFLKDDAYGLDIIALYKGLKTIDEINLKYQETYHDAFLTNEVTIKGEEND